MRLRAAQRRHFGDFAGRKRMFKLSVKPATFREI
jgi:hypothetical protein